MARTHGRKYIQNLLAAMNLHAHRGTDRQRIQRIDIAALHAEVRRPRGNSRARAHIHHFHRSHKHRARRAASFALRPVPALERRGLRRRNIRPRRRRVNWSRLPASRESYRHSISVVAPLHAHHFADLLQVGCTRHRIVRRSHAKTHALVIAIQRGEEIDGFARSVQRGAHFLKVAVIKIRGAQPHLQRNARPAHLPSFLASCGDRCGGGRLRKRSVIRHVFLAHFEASRGLAVALSNLLQAAYWSVRSGPIEQGYLRWGTKGGYCKLDPKFILSSAPFRLCVQWNSSRQNAFLSFPITWRISYRPRHNERYPLREFRVRRRFVRARRWIARRANREPRLRSWCSRNTVFCF